MTQRISVCTTVKNRAGNLSRLCQSLAKVTDRNPFELVVADFASTDTKLATRLAKHRLSTTLVTLANQYFNRSQGLNVAAAHAKGEAEDILFFIDVDMLVPGNFAVLLRKHVRPGACWFPICYSLHRGKPPIVRNSSRYPSKANGWWRKEGKGMCGFTRHDFEQLKWNESVGLSYGGEDGDICQRAVASGLKLHRDKCPGLFHIWHPTGGYRTKYHMKKSSDTPYKLVEAKVAGIVYN